jgi:hypothetical protein
MKLSKEAKLCLEKISDLDEIKLIKVCEGYTLYFPRCNNGLKYNPEFDCIVEFPGGQLYCLSVGYGVTLHSPAFTKHSESLKILRMLAETQVEIDQLYHLDRFQRKLPPGDPRWEKNQSLHPNEEVRALSPEDFKSYMNGDLVLNDLPPCPDSHETRCCKEILAHPAIVKMVQNYKDFKIHILKNDIDIALDPEFDCIVEYSSGTMARVSCRYSGMDASPSLRLHPDYKLVMVFISGLHQRFDQLYHLDRLERDLPACDPRWEKDQSLHPSEELRALSPEAYKAFLSGLAHH